MDGFAGLLRQQRQQQQQFSQSLFGQSALLGGLSGFGLASQAGLQRKPYPLSADKKKKSFKDELQLDIDNWLADIDI